MRKINQLRKCVVPEVMKQVGIQIENKIKHPIWDEASCDISHQVGGIVWFEIGVQIHNNLTLTLT
jgi:hypothetical protein